jgi:hypothetical protein
MPLRPRGCYGQARKAGPERFGEVVLKRSQVIAKCLNPPRTQGT